MSGTDLRLPQLRSLGETKRTDTWWVQPLLVFLGFSAFIVYSTWAAFQANHFVFDGGGAQYISPFYSPVLWDPPGMHTGHAWFGDAPAWLLSLFPSFIKFSPAFLILWAPGGFRFTCYYYRGAYYKAFWADPINCGVGEPGFRKENYRGEKKWPLLIQNIHRYFLYIAIVFIGLLAWDAVKSYMFHDGAGATRFGIGIGSLVMTINPILLGAYTFGCHSLRHLIGGRKNEMGEGAGRKAYDCVSCLNRRHMLWAWCSLFWVGFTDVYVRLCSMGIWSDFRFV